MLGCKLSLQLLYQLAIIINLHCQLWTTVTEVTHSMLCSLCVSGTTGSSANMAEPIDMPSQVQTETRVGQLIMY